MRGCFTIAANVPFADALAAGLLQRYQDRPEDLADVLILLPTRRGLRALRESFLRVSDGRPLLLPTMMPLGDLDEDDLVFDEADGLDLDLALAPAIGGLQRQLSLAKLIEAKEKAEGGLRADQAVRLAAELGRLLDQVQTERLDFKDLPDLVDRAEFAEHWQKTLDFLTLVTDLWPDYLAEQGYSDRASRRNRVLEAKAKAWAERPPQTPVIAAGTTGSIPATADLLATILKLPQGSVVLPGLDVGLDQAAWDRLDPVHPQFGLKRLLERLSITREEVQPWPSPLAVAAPERRLCLLADALRPAAAQSVAPDLAPVHPSDLDGLVRIDCPTPREEALSIALVMREALEVPGRRAHLVTPDRDLARRVAAEMARFDLALDDSAGIPLDQTPNGAFLRLIARAFVEDFAPVELLSLLKHPLAAGGMETVRFRTLSRDLERLCLRGVRPGPGIEGLRAVLAEDHDLQGFIDHLSALFEPLVGLSDRAGEMALADLLRAHVAVAEALAADAETAGAERLWAGEAGEVLSSFLAELEQAAPDWGTINRQAYPALLEALMAGRPVRKQQSAHPRLAVLGLLEARLQQADVVVLGGLNEGTWPPDAPASPWMSRPMMSRFGLAEPERRIGLTAHDFQQAFGAETVVLTRAERVDGTPTVPARWLTKLDNLLGEERAEELKRRGDIYALWAEGLDRPDEAPAAPRPPAARPPVAARPSELWVTDVETLMRDPYGLYAKRVLRLRALEPLDADPSAKDYGTLIHGALEAFLREGIDPGVPEALPRLLAFGRSLFRQGTYARPAIEAFWWPRFERIATWFLAVEKERKFGIEQSWVETEGEWSFPFARGTFTLRAKADRIDRLSDGSLCLIDYKTGQPPSPKEVAAGYSPQLPLEGVIAEAGGFDGGPRPVSRLDFWWLRGNEAGGAIKPAAKGNVEELVREAAEKFQALIRVFEDKDVAYEARPRPDRAPKYSDYEHLARLKEWASTEGEDG
ncbi:MAG: double-strand break repair protein AddB [Magnetovibrionaceae bacterium]